MNRWAIAAGVAAIGALLFVPRKAKATPRVRTPFKKEVYTPGSNKQIDLFRRAAKLAKVPEEWASDPGLINVLKRESGGVVGIPNYQYGALKKDPDMWPKVWADLRAGRTPKHSSATGLGQMQIANVDSCYPNGRKGIGVAIEEAAGMLCYIRKRYKTPAKAWEFWQANNWY